MTERPRARCIRCGRTPDQIGEYVDAAAEMGVSPESFVWTEEGTLNPSNGHFLCTADYIAEGSPSSPEGWIAP